MQGSAPLFPQAAAADDSASGRDLLAMVYRQFWLILVCTVLFGLLGYVFYKQQKPSFTSTARVWVQTEQQGSPSFLSGIAAYRESLVPDPVNRKIETEMELLLTRSNAASVVEKLRIADEQLARSPGQLLKERYKTYIEPWIPFKRKVPVVPGRSLPVDQFLEGVSVAPLRSKTAETTSNVLEISFECADPELAPKALGLLLENYINLGARQNRRLGEATSQLIQTKLAQAKDELRDVEDKIVALTLRESGRNDSVIATIDSSRETTASNTVNVSSSLNLNGMKLDLGPDVLRVGNAQALSTLKSQTLEMQARLDELKQLYTEDSEYVRGMRQRIAEARTRLSQGVRAGVKAEAELGRLERQRAVAQDRFIELQKKLDQIDLYLRLNPTEAESRVVIDPPYAPEAADAKKKPIVAALGPVVGLLLGMLLGGLRELFDRRIRSQREVERQLGLTVLGSIPRLSSADRQRLAGASS